MQSYDQAFVDDTVARFSRLEPDAKPLWGGMTPAQMYAHLTVAVRYSLGKEEETPNEGGFFGRWIAGPLLLNGIIKIPKNQKGPKMYDTAAPEGDLDTLRKELEEFNEHQDQPDFSPPSHPYFGDFGLEGWRRLHVIHIDHHARQFGV